MNRNITFLILAFSSMQILSMHNKQLSKKRKGSFSGENKEEKKSESKELIVYRPIKNPEKNDGELKIVHLPKITAEQLKHMYKNSFSLGSKIQKYIDANEQNLETILNCAYDLNIPDLLDSVIWKAMFHFSKQKQLKRFVNDSNYWLRGLRDDISQKIAFHLLAQKPYLHQPIKTLFPHTYNIRPVCYTSDNRHIVTGSLDDKTIKISESKTGKILQTCNHESPVHSICISPDDTRIVSGGKNGTIKIWNTKTGKGIHSVKAHQFDVYSLVFSPNGKYFASGGGTMSYGGGRIKLWNAQTGECLKTFKNNNNLIQSISFSPDNKYIASGSECNRISIWDIESGECLQNIKNEINFDDNVYPEFLYLPRGATMNKVYAVQFSPCGKFVATGSWDGTVTLWDIRSGKAVKNFPKIGSCIFSLSFSPNGRFLAAGGIDRFLQLINLKNDTRMSLAQTRDRKDIFSVCFSSDGKYLASGPKDSVDIWDIENCLSLSRLSLSQLMLLLCRYNLKELGKIPAHLTKLYDSLPEHAKEYLIKEQTYF